MKHDNLAASWLMLGLVYGKSGQDSYRSDEDIIRQIELVKKNNIKKAVVVLTLGLNEQTKKIFIAGSRGEEYSKVDFLINQLESNGIEVVLMKTHFNMVGDYSDESKEKWMARVSGGTLADFNELYYNKVMEIAERYKGKIARFCPFNEVDWTDRGSHLEFCKKTLKSLKEMGYKVTVAACGFPHILRMKKEILDMIDFISANVYPQGSITGNDCTVADIMQSFLNCENGPTEFIKYCKTNYPEKPIWLTETGCVDNPNAIVSPSNCSIIKNRYNVFDGELQAKYIEAMLNLYGKEFENICYWWELNGNKTVELLGGK